MTKDFDGSPATAESRMRATGGMAYDAAIGIDNYSIHSLTGRLNALASIRTAPQIASDDAMRQAYMRLVMGDPFVMARLSLAAETK